MTRVETWTTAAAAWCMGTLLSALWRQSIGSDLVPEVSVAVALALLLVQGRRALAGLCVGALITAWLGRASHAGLMQAVLVHGLALAEAVVAAALLRRARSRRLASPQALGRFVVVAGAVAVVGQGFAAVAGLASGGPVAPMLSHAFGFLLLTPALLAWGAVPAADWRPRRMALGVVVPVLALAASAWTARYGHALEEADRTRFAAEAKTSASALQDRLSNVLDALSTVQSLLLVSPETRGPAFEQAVRAWAGRHDLHALGVLQRVPPDALPKFEASLRGEGAPSPVVRSATGDGGVRGLAPHEEVVAIRLIAPSSRNAQVLGINSYANPHIRPAIDRTLETGQPAATAPFPLRLSEAEPGPGAEAPQRPGAQGVVVYQRIDEAAAQAARLAFVTLRLDQILPATDEGSRGLPQCLFAQAGSVRKVLADSAPDACQASSEGRHVHQAGIAFAGQSWTFETWRPHGAALREGLLVEGLALGALAVISLLLLSTSGHARLYQRVARRARVAQRDAEAAHRARLDLLERVRHELRAPLNAVLGAAQILRRPAGTSPSEVAPWIERIDHASQHLRDMIDDLLATSASAAGSLVVRDDTLPLGPLVAASVDVAMQSRHDVGWQVAEVPALWQVHGDAKRIRQVLINLLTNAAKYNVAGGQVALRTQADDAAIQIVIEDTGIGLTPEQRAMLFQPFNRLGRERSGIEGMGLGLYLSQQLALRMGGRIEAASAEAQGSRFTLCLRRAKDAEPAAPVPAPAHRTVLAFEDDETSVAILEAVLARRTGWRLVHRPRLADGVRWASELRPDIVLLDRHLADGDGLDLLARLRAEPVLAATPVLLISGESLPGDAAGVAVVPKPWDLDRLLCTIDALLAHRVADAPA